MIYARGRSHTIYSPCQQCYIDVFQISLTFNLIENHLIRSPSSQQRHPVALAQEGKHAWTGNGCPAIGLTRDGEHNDFPFSLLQRLPAVDGNRLGGHGPRDLSAGQIVPLSASSIRNGSVLLFFIILFLTLLFSPILFHLFNLSSLCALPKESSYHHE